MPVFNKTILVDERAVVAGSTVTADLPVNPQPYIDYRLTALQTSGADFVDLDRMLGYVTTVEVLLRGDPIISMSLRDLAAYAAMLYGHWPKLQNRGGLANQRVSAVFRIPFGRRRFWTQELLPPFRRGDLTFRAVYAAAFNGAASLIEHIETQEILDATPVRYLKGTTFTKTPTAAGDADSDLPIGNRILKVLLFGTTVPDGIAETASVDRLALLVDNVRLFYPETRWEELHADLLEVLQGIVPEEIRRGEFSFNPGGGDNSIAAATTEVNTAAIEGLGIDDQVFVHPQTLEDGLLLESFSITAADVVSIGVRNHTAAAVATAAGTWEYLALPNRAERLLRQYGLLDFDPLVDPEMGYALITAGRSRVHMRISHDDTQAVRYLPVEVIELAPRGV